VRAHANLLVRYNESPDQFFTRERATSPRKRLPSDLRRGHLVGCPIWGVTAIADMWASHLLRTVAALSYVASRGFRCRVMLLEPSPVAQKAHTTPRPRLTLPFSLSLSLSKGRARGPRRRSRKMMHIGSLEKLLRERIKVAGGKVGNLCDSHVPPALPHPVPFPISATPLPEKIPIASGSPTPKFQGLWRGRSPAGAAAAPPPP
jgi:hypothetical protein